MREGAGATGGQESPGAAAALRTASVEAALAHAGRLLDPSPHLAAQQAEAILQALPGHPQALLLRASALRRLGQLAQAAAILEPLAQAQPRAAAVHHEWALTRAALGDPAGAIASLQHAVRLRPDWAQAWRALGDLHTLAGASAEADAAYAQQIRAGVHDPALMQAAAALCANDLPAAEHLLRAHLRSHGSDVAALRMLAEAGTRLGRYADAEALLAQCLRLAPSFAAARYHFALVLFRQGNAADALAQLDLLLGEDPGDATVRNLHAACLALAGDAAGAVADYEMVLAAMPRQPRLWLSFGHALKTLGARSRAVQAYRTCLDLAPGLGEAWWSLANLKTEPFSAADIAAMQAALASAAPGPATEDDRLHLHYALGRALEQDRAHAASFRHYEQGARLRRSQISYSADRTHAQLERARSLLTPAFFAARQGWGCQDPAPIFIVGLPRSGSTLTEQMLASHSAVEGTMELPEITNIAVKIGRGGGEDTYPDCLATLDASGCAALGEHYLQRTRIHRRLGRPFFIDKMPNNFVHVGLIHLILPKAKIIDARRHPMAACFSAFKQHFAKGQHFSYDLDDLGRYYGDYVALMAHFDEVLPGRVHRVTYELLVEDTAAELRRLLDYCALPHEPACLRFHENARPVRTASSEQVRRPINRDGLDAWRAYERWLGPLRSALDG